MDDARGDEQSVPVRPMMDADAWDARYAEQELVWSRGPNGTVADEVRQMPPGRALDIAGGEGRNAIWLAQQGWEVELVDFSPVALDKARTAAERAGVRIKVTLADVTSELVVRPADLVVLAYLQLPRPTLARVLSTTASLVTSGGTFLLVAHARRNLVDGWGGPSDADVLPTVEEVVGGLQGTGLVMGTATELRRPVETAEGPRDAIDLLVRAHRPAGPTRGLDAGR